VLLIASLVSVGIYIVYKTTTKKGSCGFVPFVPTKSGRVSATNYAQAGYIKCDGGGGLWKPGIISIKNNGPGTFYIGPLPGSSTLNEMNPGDTVSYDFSQESVVPNVFYILGSAYTSPNLSLTY